MTLQICVAQLNFVVGDMPGNARKIIDAASAAYAQGAAALGLPELQAKFESVNAEHERQGYLSVELSHKRQRLYAELIDAAKFQLAPALYRQFYMCF